MPRQPEFDRRLAEYEREVGELQMQVKLLEEESGALRSKLADAPIRIRELEAHLLEARAEYARSREQSERMTELLRQAREQIVALREEVEKLTAPPSGYGVFLTTHEDGTIDVKEPLNITRFAIAFDPASAGRQPPDDSTPKRKPRVLIGGKEISPIKIADATPNLAGFAVSGNRHLEIFPRLGGADVMLRVNATVGNVKGPITCPSSSLQQSSSTAP